MQPGSAPVSHQQEVGQGDELYIPDLCSTGSVLVMVLLAQLMVLIYVLLGSPLPYFNWNMLAITSVFVQWVVLLSAACQCRLRVLFSRLTVQQASSGSLLLVVLVTTLSSLIAVILFPQLTPDMSRSWFVLRNDMVATVLTGIVLRYFYLQQQLRLREKMELQARLDSLSSRIRPHFLFNTMNSIASLIGSQPEAAERAVEDLSELFRASLAERERLATIADELHLCELYLDIERLRLGDRLHIQWQIDPAVKTLAMPSLLLQPLVENAVYHGIAQLPQGGQVKISVQRDHSRIVAVVSNPVPERPARSKGHKMAVSNIQQRLQALFGSDAGLQISHTDKGYSVQLHYPAAEPV
jgi:two-component system, LytTR family, sensor histidine kinase AlgZ